MKVRYKVEIHRRKGQKNETKFSWHWKTKKSDKYASSQIDFCCDEMKNAYDQGFITIPYVNHDRIDMKYDERREKATEPIVCLHSMNEDGYGESCPHNDAVLPIKHCPFCTAKIETELVEKKRITHECKMVKKTYEECEDKVTEEIL